MVPFEVLNTSPAGYVEFQARIHFGTPVEFMIPKPTTWSPRKIYQIRRVKLYQAEQTIPLSGEVKVEMTVKYSVVRFSIPDIVIQRCAAARDVINA
jgi:hypothetical protein